VKLVKANGAKGRHRSVVVDGQPLAGGTGDHVEAIRHLETDGVGAYKTVKANAGAAGVDDVTVEMFESDLKHNLYRLWNRLASGSYHPPPVKRVEIPKRDGGRRPLGIPTVGDRVAQAVIKQYLEPIAEPRFHPDSYGYRPGRSAHQALERARERCWRFKWVLEIDIRSFFDSLEHALVMRALRRLFSKLSEEGI
jgi:group II intron reverse transcriptase/maturase